MKKFTGLALILVGFMFACAGGGHWVAGLVAVVMMIAGACLAWSTEKG